MFPEKKSKDEGSEEITGVLNNLTERLEEKFTQGYDRIEKKLVEITSRQDELADQIFFNAAHDDLKEESTVEKQPLKPFHFMHDVFKEHIHTFISFEHPQVVALILSYLNSVYSSQLLSLFPGDLQIDVAERIAFMGKPNPVIIEIIENFFRKKLELIQTFDYSPAGGVTGLVEILNLTTRSVEKTVIKGLEEKNNHLAEAIKKRMFVFEDITLLAPKAVAEVMAQTESKILLISLKGTIPEVREYILGCLAEEEKEKIVSELNEMGKVRLKDVEAAQKGILSTIRKMEEKGRIIVARPGELIG